MCESPEAVNKEKAHGRPMGFSVTRQHEYGRRR